MLYTTYFARLKHLPEGIVPISICGKAPDGYTGLQYKTLAPKWGFFSEYKKTRDAHHYTKCFHEQVLAGLDANEVYHTLVSMAGSSDIALVCYETPEKFCHRHIVANWFRESGIPIKEFGC